jgi:8-oxo-dGTP diphosphatase
MGKRKRGTAIIETEKGILLNAIKHQYLLPGGGPKKDESRFQAAIRETKEETGLEPYYAKILFQYESSSNNHTVVLIKAKGKARPKSEVSKIKYYKPGIKLSMSSATKKIIEKYYNWKESKN